MEDEVESESRPADASPAPLSPPGRVKPAQLPPLEFAPPLDDSPDDSPLVPHTPHKLPPPPPRYPKVPAKWVQWLGLIFVPPALSAICALFMFFAFMPGGRHLSEQMRREGVNFGRMTVYATILGAIIGEIAGLILWWRITHAPDNDKPHSPEPQKKEQA